MTTDVSATADTTPHEHGSRHPLGFTARFALQGSGWLFLIVAADAVAFALLPQSGGPPQWMQVSGAVAFILGGLLLLRLPRAPRWLLNLVPLAGAAGVGWYSWFGEPALGSYMFSLLSIAFSGLFLGRLNLAITFLAVVITHGVAAATADGGHLRPQWWLLTMMVSTSVALLVRVLREHLDAVTADLARVATRDALTGLLNRHGIVSAHVPPSTATSVVVFDLDNFKQLNDTRGHAEGDRALSAFARLLAGHARHEDVVGRTGGEEFVAILPGCGGPQAVAFAERVRRAVADERRAGTPYTVSAGVASSDSGSPIEDLQREADRALYRAKEEGRNRVVASTVAVGGAGTARRGEAPRPPELSWADLMRATWRAAVTGARRPGVGDRAARRAAGALYVIGGTVCAAITLTLPVIHGHRDGLLWLAAAMGAFGVAMLSIPHLDPVARLVPYIGVVTVSAVVAMADPYTGAMSFMAWPLLFTAYFFSARVVVTSLLLALAGLGIALWVDVEHVSPVTMWVNATFASVLITLLTLMVQLHIERVHAVLADLATTDALTGLPNRGAFYARAETAAAGPHAVVLFDLDHFKAINDRAGHDAGDAVLRMFAAALREGARAGDTVARHGGEEFAAVLRGADARSARAFAERVRSAFHDDALREGWDVTCSAGVCVADAGAGDAVARLDEGIGRADAALYAAKRDGRDAVRVWEPVEGGSGAG